MSNLASQNAFSFSNERDLMQELLADKRSLETKRAYERCLRDFFRTIAQAEVSPQLIHDFLNLERPIAIQLTLRYKAHLIDKGLAEATINQRLAAIKSLVTYAQKVGQCVWSLQEIQGEKVRTYRDTSGVSPIEYRKMMDTCDRSSPIGARNYAILRLIWDNALRRGEIVKLNIADFDASGQKLVILGKGRGTQRESVSLSAKAVEAIGEWLLLHPSPLPSQPLFVSLDRVFGGGRLTGDGIYTIARSVAEKAGIQKVFSPHRGRHSSITAALDATGGDVRRVQQLSRHYSIEIVARYDDNRKNLQSGVTQTLSDLV